MNRTIEEIYTSFALNIHNSIDDNWECVVLHIEFSGEDAIAFKGYCDNNGNKASLSLRRFDRRKLVNDTRDLHEITTHNASNRWNRAIYTLRKSDDFTIDFQWDQALADEIERLANS